MYTRSGCWKASDEVNAEQAMAKTMRRRLMAQVLYPVPRTGVNRGDGPMRGLRKRLDTGRGCSRILLVFFTGRGFAQIDADQEPGYGERLSARSRAVVPALARGVDRKPGESQAGQQFSAGL